MVEASVAKPMTRKTGTVGSAIRLLRMPAVLCCLRSPVFNTDTLFTGLSSKKLSSSRSVGALCFGSVVAWIKANVASRTAKSMNGWQQRMLKASWKTKSEKRGKLEETDAKNAHKSVCTRRVVFFGLTTVGSAVLSFKGSFSRLAAFTTRHQNRTNLIGAGWSWCVCAVRVWGCLRLGWPEKDGPTLSLDNDPTVGDQT